MQDNVKYHTLKSEILQLLPKKCLTLRRKIFDLRYSIDELTKIRDSLKKKSIDLSKDKFNNLDEQQILLLF